MVEQLNSDGGTAFWNSVVEEWWNSDGGTVMVEQCGGTVLWNSVVEQ